MGDLDKYIGLQKGVLTVTEILEPAVNNKNTVVKCKCSRCGQYSEVKLDRFTTHTTYAEHYCSHCQDAYFLEKMKEKYIGKSCGVLTCLDVLPGKVKGRRMAVCECSICGKISEVRLDRFREDDYQPKSCTHCYKDLFRQITKERYYKEYGCTGEEYESKRHDGERLHSFKCGAKQRNLEYNLTYSQAVSLLHSNCYYCGQPHADGIDRLDSSKGYTSENCVPCCSICNIMKNKFDTETFFKHVQLIYNNHFIK